VNKYFVIIENRITRVTRRISVEAASSDLAVAKGKETLRDNEYVKAYKPKKGSALRPPLSRLY
jgi:hypothetical protein